MTITVAQLRLDYPEFSDNVMFDDSQVQFWLNFAYKFLNASRWGTSLDMGAELYAAHHLSIEARAQAEASNGSPPGQSSGIVSSKSVDKVSISYDTTGGIQPDAGHWNLTIYGTRFIRLMRMFGAGPLQIGIGAAPSLSGQAWSGPYPFP